jgi:hypothetical protein
MICQIKIIDPHNLDIHFLKPTQNHPISFICTNTIPFFLYFCSSTATSSSGEHTKKALTEALIFNSLYEFILFFPSCKALSRNIPETMKYPKKNRTVRIIATIFIFITCFCQIIAQAGGRVQYKNARAGRLLLPIK